jgi:hypothetical protein
MFSSSQAPDNLLFCFLTPFAMAEIRPCSGEYNCKIRSASPKSVARRQMTSVVYVLAVIRDIMRSPTPGRQAVSAIVSKLPGKRKKPHQEKATGKHLAIPPCLCFFSSYHANDCVPPSSSSAAPSSGWLAVDVDWDALHSLAKRFTPLKRTVSPNRLRFFFVSTKNPCPAFKLWSPQLARHEPHYHL